MGKFGNGRIVNYSDKSLWVVAEGKVYKLRPGRSSPRHVDADAVKAVDGSGIYSKDLGMLWGHRSWWKVIDIDTAWVFNALITRGDLIIDTFILAPIPVGEDHFGSLTYIDSWDWGE